MSEENPYVPRLFRTSVSNVILTDRCNPRIHSETSPITPMSLDCIAEKMNNEKGDILCYTGPLFLLLNLNFRKIFTIDTRL